MDLLINNKSRKLIAIYVLSVCSLFTLSSIVAIAAGEHPAQKLVVDSTTELLAVMKKESERIKEDPAFLQEQIERYVVPHVDFETMTKRAVGKAWRQATNDQRIELKTEFKALLLNIYTSALTSYGGETIEFKPFKPERREDRAIVRSSFKRSGDSGTVPVLYKLREENGSWLIWDIQVDQVSLGISSQSAFSNEIEKGGIEGLLKTMKDKNAES
ncbi:ABC transporter substrate-binding protein [Granulosicoccus sp.]|nr:ABC transporter substrate-binding protein [Granulosicoccus sp.]